MQRGFTTSVSQGGKDNTLSSHGPHEMLTYRPAVDDDEGLRFWVKTALCDGLGPAGHDVAHVIIWDLGRAQGELGHDVGVV